MATQTLKSTALSKVLINEFTTDNIVLATQAEVASAISQAVAGLWDWKGSAKAISADGTKITLNDDSEVTAAAANKGHVYQIGDKEYASNGSKWEMLGFNIDLSGYVLKETGKSLIADTEITRLAGMSTGANKVEASATNGNIKIDGTETTVYTLPSDVVQDASYAHITVTSTSVSDGVNTFNKYVLPSDVVQDASYAHITVTGTSVSDGTTTLSITDKVDKVSGSSLVPDTEITKLSGVSAGANKVEASTTNGNIKIDGVETTVYTEVANTVHDANYAHITVTSTSVSDGTNTFNKYVLPSDVVQDSNYAHITVTSTSVSDGTNTFTKFELPSDVVQDSSYAHITVTSTSVSDGTTTFNKYDDTALQSAVAGKAAKVTGAITALATDYSIEDIATAVSALITKINAMNS